MEVLKYYQYPKLEFLFDEIKNELGHDMSKSYNEMTEAKSIPFYTDIGKSHSMIKQARRGEHGKALMNIIGMYMFISKSIIKEHMKASKEWMTCPICEGSVLNHHKQLKFGDTDIREIIQQPIDQVLKTVGALPQLVKLKAVVGGDMILTEDVSLLPRETQVALKMFELEHSKLFEL